MTKSQSPRKQSPARPAPKSTAPATPKSTAPATPKSTAPATPSPSTNPAFVVVAPPPLASLPNVPEGFVPVDMKYYLGTLPKGAQLTVMAGAVTELRDKFPNYSTVFGTTAPPLPSVLQAFDVANQWSAMHGKLDVLSVYCASQEALAWYEVHGFMARLRPAFTLAVTANAAVASEHPSLTRLFGAQKEIAQKAVTTRKANKQLKAEGKLPIKGKSGQRRKRVAANALLTASQAAPMPATSTTPASTSAAKPTPPRRRRRIADRRRLAT